MTMDAGHPTSSLGVRLLWVPVPGTRQHSGGTRLLGAGFLPGRQQKGRALPKPSPCRAAGAGPAARPVHLVCACKEKLRNHQKEKRGAVHDHQLTAGLTPSGKSRSSQEITQGKHRIVLPQGQQSRNRELLALPLLTQTWIVQPT